MDRAHGAFPRHGRRHAPGRILGAALLALAWSGFPARTAADQRVDDAREPITPLAAAASTEDAGKVRLGQALFRDQRLSSNERLACTSCHDVEHNGASAKSRDVGADGSQMLFNTPTVFNVSLNFLYNWEGQRRSLEQQTEFSLRNPQVMGGDPAVVAARLRGDRGLQELARAAYGKEMDERILIDALAQYQRSLNTPGSRFDRWLQGDATALSETEIRGYRTFKEVGCSACHQGVNVGGNLYQRSGVFGPLAGNRIRRMRVPGLRNVAATAPYFHDGSAATLEQAVRAMGKAQLGIELQDSEVSDIAAFLGSLTGYRGNRPVGPPPR